MSSSMARPRTRTRFDRHYLQWVTNSVRDVLETGRNDHHRFKVHDVGLKIRFRVRRPRTYPDHEFA